MKSIHVILLIDSLSEDKIDRKIVSRLSRELKPKTNNNKKKTKKVS